MTRRLVLVHGRDQQKKDAVALKAEWVDALRSGLRENGLELPIAESDIRFPYYGDTLYQLDSGVSTEDAAAVILRGDGVPGEEQRFLHAVMMDLLQRHEVTEEQIDEVADSDVIERGPRDWGWVRATARAIDRFVPGASSAVLILFTSDVYVYLTNPAIRTAIDTGVASALAPGAESVVVGHSLGSVVAYNVLRHQRAAGGSGGRRTVPLFVTLGSPLAVTAIRRVLEKPTRCPECASHWFNALDERDFVALHPLDTTHFPLSPEEPGISNKDDVHNSTANRHGISGYLQDKDVARRIHDALVGTSPVP
ncbi:hypothetical protein SAMN06265360_1178 [Haloechinothrix alba]|uniref:Alpha/beta hydrolase n=1 Tax=Haloechinothrix alba TaxID=664784 RepID=A0A238YU01_9PSEU|nr:hypothetical protein [Haloechinothrix alba]SNR74063.1 hypothetical protein SAMN06265360_1178 [Haloechinothrix alba]